MMGANGCKDEVSLGVNSGRRIKNLLIRVTGGAKGRGEQIRSFMKEEK
jgi:hypothetical protein